MMPPGGTDVHSWQVPGLSRVTGGMGSGTSPPYSLRSQIVPCTNPPMAAFLNWGSGRAGSGQSAGPSSHTRISACKKRGRRTHRGLFWLSA